MYKLVIAEKPSVGKDIADIIIGNYKKEDGYFSGNGFKITWGIGHLVGLANPEEYEEGLKEWKNDTLPIIPEEMKLTVNQKTRKQYSIVKKLINDKETESIIIATDAGREGELIARYILKMAGNKKMCQRLWISSLTEESIREGFKNLKDSKLYDNLYASAKSRSEADWLIGINATRVYSIKHKTLLSIGRVQTPTLAMIVNRHIEIKDFKPQKYFQILGTFNNYKGLWFKENINKIEDEKKADEIINKIRNKNGIIRDITYEDKAILPPLLYDLTELQRDGNKYFDYTAQKTLTIAQVLYEKHKLITYPRTDSRYISEDMIPTLKERLLKIKNIYLSKYIENLLLNELNITKRIVDNSKVSDHHAIIPTSKPPNLNDLSEDEKNIYKLIIKRFVSVFLPKYEYMITNIVTDIEGESFITKGKTIKNLGWKELYIKDFEDEEEINEQQLPTVVGGEIVQLNNVEKLLKYTTPPKPYNEATLLSAMESAGRFVEDEELKEHLKGSGIGTPATRASIIERLIKVGYIERKKKCLIPTEKGIRLIEIVIDDLKSPEMTGEWEKKLSEIEKGNIDANKFMDEIKCLTRTIVKDVMNSKDYNFQTEKKEKEVIGICPDCGRSIFENQKSFYCEGYSDNNNPCKFTLWKEDKWFANYKKKITKTIAKKLLKDKKVQVKDLYSEKKKKKFDAVIVMFKSGEYWSFKFNFDSK